MKNKRPIIIATAVPLLAILGYLGLRWLAPSSRLPSTTDTTKHTPQPQSRSRAKQQTKPSADVQPSNVPWAELKDDDPWMIFHNNSVELMIKAFERDGVTITPEKLESIRLQLARQHETMKAAGEAIPELPTLSDIPPPRIEYSNSRGKLHEGPQTVEAIMESFEAMDGASPLSTDDDEVDPKIPARRMDTAHA